MLHDSLIEFAHTLKNIAKARLVNTGIHPSVIIAIGPRGSQAIYPIIGKTSAEITLSMLDISKTIKERGFTGCVIVSVNNTVIGAFNQPNQNTDALIFDAQTIEFRYVIAIPFINVGGRIMFEQERIVNTKERPDVKLDSDCPLMF